MSIRETKPLDTLCEISTQLSNIDLIGEPKVTCDIVNDVRQAVEEAVGRLASYKSETEVQRHKPNRLITRTPKGI